MKKIGLKCSIRKANPYRRMMKATKEHSVCENLVNRNFKTICAVFWEYSITKHDDVLLSRRHVL